MAKMEEKWRVFWEEHSTYAFNPDARGEIYSIDSPPPTVSGDLHMGHSFSYVILNVPMYKNSFGYVFK